MNSRINAAHYSVIACADTHFSVYHKRDPAKHFLFFHVWNISQRFPYTVR
jgi:hypothetical protein